MGTWAQEHASPSTSTALTASSYLEQVALFGVGDFLLPFPVQPGKTAKRWPLPKTSGQLPVFMYGGETAAQGELRLVQDPIWSG